MNMRQGTTTERRDGLGNPKVFEFAKEVDMAPLELVKKLREWGVDVKSHMSELDDTAISVVKQKLAEPEEPVAAKKKVKKKVAKKKAAKKKVAKKATGTKTTKKKKTVTKKKAATTVIRKKSAAKKAPAPEEAVENVIEAPVQEAEVVAKEQGAVEEVAAPEEQKVEKAVKKEKTVKKSAKKRAEVEDEDSSDGDKGQKATRPLKREVAIGSGPKVDTPQRKPRKNIVGHMDLGKAEQRFKFKSQNPSAARNTNIRPGFVAAPQMDVMPPKKEDDRPKRKITKAGPGGAGAGTAEGSAKEEEVPTFISSDYKKREMLFQPRKKSNVLNREARKTQITQPKASKRIVKMYETITVADLAKEMQIKSGQLTSALMKNGIMVKANETVDFETAALVATDFGYEVETMHRSVEELIKSAAFGDLNAEPTSRPPIVTIMGHVDHGKTTLLDGIRNADVAAKEAGGITQHIGAYSVKLEDGNTITFIDTPGHEAFTAMRARGANVTDIAIIVVAADDGVMPQTEEAINHAKSAGVTIIVAINKMDVPGANPEKIRQKMTEYELVPEEWGGQTIFCEVSALKGTGIKELLEQIHLVAEVHELKANDKCSATGIVIESKVEKGRGVVATLLVKEGTLEKGQVIVAGKALGRVRSMMNERGQQMKDAGPSVPVEVLGLEGPPSAGDRFDACVSEDAARKIIEFRVEQELAEANKGKMSLEEIFAKAKAGDVQELQIILKTDVAGSGEAIKGMLDKVSTDEVKVKVVHSAVGGITESDVLLASTTKGMILGFNVRPDSKAAQLAHDKGIEIKCYSIIYELVDDVRKALSGLLSPDIVENVLGRAEVRDTFSVPKVGTIAGCYVQDGKILRSALVRLIRDGRMIYEGKLGSLRRFKDDAKEVASGYECGIGIENFNDVKEGDIIEAYEKTEIAREL